MTHDAGNRNAQSGGSGPVRTEKQAKQGGKPRMMVMVLLVSLLLAFIVGWALLSNTDKLGGSSSAGKPPAETPSGGY